LDEDGSAAKILTYPSSFDQMSNFCASAMSDAYKSGVTRQTVRILLPRIRENADLGIYYEEDANVDANSNVVLVPPDETWQGGIMQLYRVASLSCREILRQYSGDTAGLPPKIIEDRSCDESGVDGVGLWTTQSVDRNDDMKCFLQPLQETVDAIETISQKADNQLVVLMNPQWRDVDDALDTASKSSGFLGSFASFLGGKGSSLKRLQESGFQSIFALEGYVCKGGNVRLMKRFDSDWFVFAESDSEPEKYIPMGISKSRPTYQEVDKMLVDNGVGLKYARDFGLAPKLE